MPNEDYQVQNTLHYSRKTFKNSNCNPLEAYSSSRRDDTTDDLPESPRSDRVTIDTVGCSCDFDSEGEVANILHKKCHIIALAQQQLDRLLDETDKFLCDNTRCCRSVIDFLILCKESLWSQNKCLCLLIALIILGFLIGLILGAASCGTTYRKFNSPILACIDNLFMLDCYQTSKESFRGIV